ncbi:MAG: hypothetical protein J4N90_12640 [Chloroflexi bacterium]|nr:hypothetical protein [Chloroflexota bacterium]
MEETMVRFMRSTKNVGDTVVFSCVVEYSSNLDPFLPQDLKKQTDFPPHRNHWSGVQGDVVVGRANGVKSTVSPFENGRGSFTSSSIERAVTVEAEIKAKLQTAYQALVERRELTAKWTGARDYGLDLISSEANHEESMASLTVREQLGEE